MRSSSEKYIYQYNSATCWRYGRLTLTKGLAKGQARKSLDIFIETKYDTTMERSFAS